MEERALRGYSTPPHVHGREDETLFVIEGTLEYVVDGVAGTANAGEAVFLPRGISHNFTVVSDEAHFLVIITPGGFEQFFLQVSPSAGAERLPGSDDHAHTDPAQMVKSAAALGTTVFRGGDGVPAGRLATRAPAELDPAYRVVEEILLGAGPLPADLDAVIAGLAATAEYITENPVHARSLLLLGILAESNGSKVALVAVKLLTAIDSGLPDSTALAFAYFLAHFPEHATAIESATPRLALPEADLARLRRCLEQPDFTGVDPLRRLGRVWPSPATWGLDANESVADEQWRAGLGLGPEAVEALWHSETTALLAFMGARADRAIERSN